MDDQKAVDQLLDDVLLGDDPALTAALADSAAAGLPPIEVTRQAAHFLSLLIQMCGARRVLEIGTLGGYSTISLARAVGPQGRVVTLEFEPRHAEIAAANLERAGIADRVEIIVGAALLTLPRLSGEFDFVFIDADKENNSAYVQWAIDLGHPGTVIVVDNVIRNGRVLHPAADDAQATAVRAMLEMMGRHPRLDTAAIQTVGGKGWDGFALALVSG
ncbi:O-methyltransferase [Mycolicibacterium komossense]|uniref:O-methyltransferase n=1 Tax=Mycolicibacterium komossense TaxID=1779 RepID=A0ABT3C8E3_9MYCO|nr:O-methyltransferase [Mycolicibacterium komossense]MCV7225711.1 O-methyltransferase [Mycolicibacterium komossense]